MDSARIPERFRNDPAMIPLRFRYELCVKFAGNLQEICMLYEI